MLYEGKIWLGTGEHPVCLLPQMANRHGLIAGATGTGKTVSLKVLAEGFSDMGVPVFLADIKGDLAGMVQPGTHSDNIANRLTQCGVPTFEYRTFPTVFWDVFGKEGHPVRTTVSEMGPTLLARLMNLNDTQAGVLSILFRVADDENMLLLDLKDLKVMLAYVGEHAKEYTLDYGNVSTAQDLAKIAAACAENQTFAQVAGTASYVLPATNLRKAEYTISSSNSLMNSESANYREYVQWVKGGFTTLAGRCTVAFAQQDGHNYGLVILGCDTLDHLFTACDDLFDWAFASFADRPLVDTKTVLTTVDLTKCRTEPAVELYAAAPVSGYGHSDDKVSYSFDLPESVSATVKEGQKLGTATVYLDGYEVGQVDLVTHREYVSDFRTDIKATLLLLCALILILCALGFVTLRCGGGLTLNQRRRQMKKRR